MDQIVKQEVVHNKLRESKMSEEKSFLFETLAYFPFLVSHTQGSLLQPLKGTFYNAKKPTLLLGVRTPYSNQNDPLIRGNRSRYSICEHLYEDHDC